MRLSQRLQSVPAYPFARWNEECRRVAESGIDIIRLDMGNPDLPPPPSVTRELREQAKMTTCHGYAGYRGIASLRETIASHYASRFGVRLDPENEVVPLLGSKEGIVNLALATLNPGDVALVPSPAYAPYARSALLSGAEPYFFPLIEDRGFLPDLGALPPETVRRARVLWLNYPNNPTGATASIEFLAEAVAFARANDLLLCHDAPYADVTFGGYVAPSVLQVAEAANVAIEFNSLSKTFNMAGWRVGMAVGCPDVLAGLARIKSNVDSGIFLPIQKAAARALQIDRTWIEARNGIYRERLETIVEGLDAAGLRAAVPRATPYVWAGLPKGVDSEAVARVLLKRKGVSVAPGAFFGPAGGGSLRGSVTVSTNRVVEAATRLRDLPADWLDAMQEGS